MVGIANVQLNKQLQMDSELSLEKAINKMRHSEMVREQQELLRATDSKSVDVHAIKARGRWRFKPMEGGKKVSCKFCAHTHTYGL